MAQKRTTTRSRAGAKLYVKRSKTGQFTDIQTYQRAHGSDVKRWAKAEVARRGTKPQGTKLREDAARHPQKRSDRPVRQLRPLLVSLPLVPGILIGSGSGQEAGKGRPAPPPQDVVQQAQTPHAVPFTRPEQQKTPHDQQDPGKDAPSAAASETQRTRGRDSASTSRATHSMRSVQCSPPRKSCRPTSRRSPR